MPEIEGANLTCGRYDRNNGDLKGAFYETKTHSNGVYFIKNKRTAKYADIEGPYMTEGTQIHQWEFNGNSSQRWIFTHLGDGYYSIKSANSVSDYYMGVQNDGTATDTPIVLRTGTLTDGMK